jgi:hypothetical protein
MARLRTMLLTLAVAALLLVATATTALAGITMTGIDCALPTLQARPKETALRAVRCLPSLDPTPSPIRTTNRGPVSGTGVVGWCKYRDGFGHRCAARPSKPYPQSGL